MKWFFLLLLLANLAILVQGVQYEKQLAKAKPVLPKAVGDLQTIPEVEQPEEVVLTSPKVVDASTARALEMSVPEPEKSKNDTPPIPEPVAEPQWMCGILGPIDRGAKAREFLGRLKESGYQGSLRREIYQNTIGYSVIIPPLGSQSAAIEAVKRLKANGVKDLRRFVKDEVRNGISLGVFSKRSNAESRRRSIAKMGYKVKVQPRTIEVLVYWIDFRRLSTTGMDLLQQLKHDEPDIEVKDQNCPQIINQ
ncbi:MAG: hypothetical protein GY696_06280 [Gammaproteobacteria bacterium]|nr:hypothetical protein [Gammaproteobacteria bacterium]